MKGRQGEAREDKIKGKKRERRILKKEIEIQTSLGSIAFGKMTSGNKKERGSIE